MKNNKPEKMIKPRHKIIERILTPIFGIYSKIAYRYRVEKLNIPKGPALILSNHVCALDPAFVGYAMQKPVYFVGMEDLLSRKGLGPFLKWTFNMIPKAKAQSDPRSVKMILRVIKEGGRVILFPSGNRTYDGAPTHIDPSISKLCKLLNVPIVLLNLVGGYGSDPRWAYKKRRGKVTLIKRDIIMPDELSILSNDEIYDRIIKGLDVNEDESVKFKSRRKAEYLERLLFICPDCHSYNTLHSNKNTIKCSICGYEAEYKEDLSFKLLNGDTYLKDVKDWHKMQKDYVSKLDFTNESLLFTEENVNLYKIYPSKRKDKYLMNATFKCYSDKLVIESEKESFTIPFNDAINVCAVGKHKANFTFDNQIYQIDGDKRCNAYKYVMMYYHYHNTINNSLGNDEYFGM